MFFLKWINLDIPPFILNRNAEKWGKEILNLYDGYQIYQLNCAALSAHQGHSADAA